MSKHDYYEILGVDKNANETDIKKAYRQMALKYHPDKNPGDKNAEEKFKEAAEAYEILSNPDKRRQYDQFGHAGIGGSNGYHMNIDDIFSHFGDIFGNPFEGFGGFRTNKRQKKVNKGSNLRIELNLTLEEVVSGVEKQIKLSKQIFCDKCNGSGAEGSSSYHTCSSCNGSGQVAQVSRSFLQMYKP
jgi:molecular chaperone DnaJ